MIRWLFSLRWRFNLLHVPDYLFVNNFCEMYLRMLVGENLITLLITICARFFNHNQSRASDKLPLSNSWLIRPNTNQTRLLMAKIRRDVKMTSWYLETYWNCLSRLWKATLLLPLMLSLRCRIVTYTQSTTTISEHSAHGSGKEIKNWFLSSSWDVLISWKLFSFIPSSLSFESRDWISSRVKVVLMWIWLSWWLLLRIHN